MSPHRRRPPIRVLVVDDSPTAREALSGLLALDPRIRVVGSASDGLEAIDLARTERPDVITMDLHMPRIDGIEAIGRIMREAPSRIVVVSSLEQKELDLSFRALQAGAVEVVAKVDAARREDPAAWARRVAETVVLMSEVPVVQRRDPGVGRPGRSLEAFGFVASTGGPPALAEILGALPAGLPFPLLVVQHVARGFGAGLVRWLQGTTKLTLVVAESGARIAPGHVYVAPDDRDVEVHAGGVLRVSPARDKSGGPSGDRLLASLAGAFGSRTGGAVLTGMGEDGARGLRAIRDAGGVTFAQDAVTSVVYGMPHAAVLRGAVQKELTPDAIAAALRELVAS